MLYALCILICVFNDLIQNHGRFISLPDTGSDLQIVDITCNRSYFNTICISV